MGGGAGLDWAVVKRPAVARVLGSGLAAAPQGEERNMFPSKLAPGLKGQSQTVVKRQDLASAYGNTGVDVMSSMTLMTLLEQAAIAALGPALEPGQMTVGARMEMDHLAPTPEGFTVKAEAELMEVAGRKLVFGLTASDGLDTVAKATHVRFVVESQRFFQGVADKQSRKP